MVNTDVKEKNSFDKRMNESQNSRLSLKENMPGKEEVSKKLLLHPHFNAIIQDLKKIHVSIPNTPSSIQFDHQKNAFPMNDQILTTVEEIQAIDLNINNGIDFKESIITSAYDESITKYEGLEGTAFLASHSLIILSKTEYIPTNLLTLNFYTRSNELSGQSRFIKEVSDPYIESQRDFIKDKLNFLITYAPQGSLLLIDGPLIGGDLYTYMIKAINDFKEKNIIPIFIVKNSTSSIIVSQLKQLQGKYNSDLHWAYKLLKPGQRSNFFIYADRHNRKNAKIFCYLKTFNISPQRIEFHVDTYHRYKEQLPSIINFIYYLIMVQGDQKNPQARPIAIAEKYARETIKLINLPNEMKKAGIVPTMNQERFAW